MLRPSHLMVLALAATGCAGLNNRQLKKIEYGSDNLAYFTGDGGVVLYKRRPTTQSFVDNPCVLFNPSNNKVKSRLLNCDDDEEIKAVREAVSSADPDGNWILLPMPPGQYFVDRNADGKIGPYKDGLKHNRFDDGLVCVMPPVQAARVSAAEGGGTGRADVSTPDGSTVGASGSGYGASTIGVQQLFEHSQSAWFLQVALYRLCEARLNGVITEDEYKALYKTAFDKTVEKLGEELDSQQAVAISGAALSASASLLKATEQDLAQSQDDAIRKSILEKLGTMRDELDARILRAVLGQEIAPATSEPSASVDGTTSGTTVNVTVENGGTSDEPSNASSNSPSDNNAGR